MVDADQLVAEIKGQLSVLGADYVSALLVALLGKEVAKIPDNEVKRLIRIGMLKEREVGGIKIGGLDPTAIVMMMGELTAQLGAGEIEAARNWTLDQWVDEVRAQREEPADEAEEPFGGEDEQWPVQIAPISVTAPADMTPRQRDSWTQARTRAGEFCRGLGNRMIDEMGTILTEVWDGETPLFVPDAEKRARFIDAIQEATSEAVARGWTAKKLASEIGHRTGDWARDLLRIARTELQGAYNDAVVMQAVKQDGMDARIARVPQAGACEACEAILLDEDGKPRIFTVRELAANGTNVGLRVSEWRATIWPIHPNCRCGAVHVMDGFTVDEMGALEWSLDDL